MMRPDLEEVKRYAAEGYTVCPVCREILSDFRTPIEVMRALMKVDEHCFMLESADSSKRWGQYSFLGYGAKSTITLKDGVIDIDGRKKKTADPNADIREYLKGYRAPNVPGMPPFTGGLVGYFSYDYLKYSEPTLGFKAKDSEGFRDADLMLFDRLIVFDNFAQRMLVIVNIRLDDPEGNYRAAEREIADMIDLVRNGAPRTDLSGHLRGEFRALFDEEQYCAMVERTKEHIREGDIFQAVISNRLEAEFEGSLFDTYRILRTLNPSPYMFFLSGTDIEVAGASPETLVKLENGILHTFPLAGTRPRGRTEEEDLALERDLLSDPKELAEHNMLVDLGRNDLGRISEFGSVEVESYHTVERYSHVMHIGSTVRGRIGKDRDALDAVSSVLPAGTLSGAPKIRACQIIDSLENDKRGIYGGGIGYIDFSGNLDLCIAIRIAYRKNGRVFIRSGAGIVADSVPENEFRECLNKAAAVVSAIKKAEAGDL